MSSDEALGLKGSELQVYALVHSYSRNEGGCYWGSLETTSEICGFSRGTAKNAFKSLLSKGLIRKKKAVIDGENRCIYSAVPWGGSKIDLGQNLPGQNLPQGGSKIDLGGRAKFDPNNKDIDNKSITKSKDPAPLILPFSSDRFRQTWEALCEEKEWKKKSDNALRLTLKKLGRYDEAFAIELMERAIEGGWRGVVFQDTDAKYQEWKSARQLKEDNRQPRTTPAQGKPRQIDPNNQVDAFYREKRMKEEEERARLIAELKAKHGIRDGDANDKAGG